MNLTVSEKNAAQTEIVRALFKLGCASSAYLSNEIEPRLTSDEILKILEEMEAQNIVSRVHDPSDPRDYHPSHVQFELFPCRGPRTGFSRNILTPLWTILSRRNPLLKFLKKQSESKR